MAKPSAKTYRPTRRNLAFLANRLRRGELVAVPTETVYGLAANAFDARACRKIFQAKGRPSTDPLIIHLHSLAQLESVARSNPSALRLAKACWPGPLTIILPKQPAVPAIVTSGRTSVAVRIPSHPVFRQLLKRAGVPLAAPSANPFGYISPTSAQHVRDGMGHKIKYILDGGEAQLGLESTIVDLRHPRRPVLLRPGFITAARLARILDQRVWVHKAPPNRSSERGQLSPGLLLRHYSPHTPLVLHSTLRKLSAVRPGEALLFLRKPSGPTRPNVFELDARGDLRGAARRLFAMLRSLDAMKFTRIHVALAPGHGLADAINDRLRRAAAR